MNKTLAALLTALLLVGIFAVVKNNNRIENRPAETVNVPQEPLPDSPPANPDTGTQPSSGLARCYVGGCSSQICSDKPDMVSTCEYRAEYACYRNAKCERQSSGQCGWTQTPALLQCLANPPQE